MIWESTTASDEEKKYQMEGVKDVIRYCSNNTKCRRMLILRYFGEKFDSSNCHKNCDNCMDTRPSSDVDLTAAGIDMVRMVQMLGTVDWTKSLCVDALRGQNNKGIREKGLDTGANPFYAKAKDVSREHCEQLVDYLLDEDALQETCVSRGNWNQLYIKVRPRGLPTIPD